MGCTFEYIIFNKEIGKNITRSWDLKSRMGWGGGGAGNRMQVEVNKYTEGTKENAIRSNGMPESFIRYDNNS